MEGIGTLLVAGGFCMLILIIHAWLSRKYEKKLYSTTNDYVFVCLNRRDESMYEESRVCNSFNEALNEALKLLVEKHRTDGYKYVEIYLNENFVRAIQYTPGIESQIKS